MLPGELQHLAPAHKYRRANPRGDTPPPVSAGDVPVSRSSQGSGDSMEVDELGGGAHGDIDMGKAPVSASKRGFKDMLEENMKASEEECRAKGPKGQRVKGEGCIMYRNAGGARRFRTSMLL